MTDQPRKAFEAWCNSKSLSPTNGRFEIWQAGRKQAIEECVAACVDKASESDGDMNFRDGCHECADKLKELL